jgi:transcriptional regulator with XRE-family HTH domain
MTKPSKHSRAINGRALYEARMRLGLTQAQVSELMREAGAHMDDSRVSKLELGKHRRPNPRLRAVLAQVLHLTDEQMYAPCRTCGREWSAACMEHPVGREAAPERSGAAA